MPAQGHHRRVRFLPRPDAGAAVLRTADQPPAVAGERQAEHGAAVAGQRPRRLLGGRFPAQLPNPDVGAVGGRQEVRVGRDRDGLDGAAALPLTLRRPAGPGLPNADAAVGVAGDQPSFIGGQGQRFDPLAGGNSQRVPLAKKPQPAPFPMAAEGVGWLGHRREDIFGFEKRVVLDLFVRQADAGDVALLFFAAFGVFGLPPEPDPPAFFWLRASSRDFSASWRAPSASRRASSAFCFCFKASSRDVSASAWAVMASPRATSARFRSSTASRRFESIMNEASRHDQQDGGDQHADQPPLERQPLLPGVALALGRQQLAPHGGVARILLDQQRQAEIEILSAQRALGVRQPGAGQTRGGVPIGIP